MCPEELAELGDVVSFFDFVCSLEIDERDVMSFDDRVLQRPGHLFFIDVQRVHGVAFVEDFLEYCSEFPLADEVFQVLAFDEFIREVPCGVEEVRWSDVVFVEFFEPFGFFANCVECFACCAFDLDRDFFLPVLSGVYNASFSSGEVRDIIYSFVVEVLQDGAFLDAVDVDVFEEVVLFPELFFLE